MLLSRISRKIYHQVTSSYSLQFASRACFARNRMPLQSRVNLGEPQDPQQHRAKDSPSKEQIPPPLKSVDESKHIAKPWQKKKESQISKREQIDILDRLQNPSDKELSSDEIKSLMNADRRDQQMAMNIINESSIDDFERDLDDQINKRIMNNESPSEIIKAMMSGKLTAKELPEQQEQQHRKVGSQRTKTISAEDKAKSKDFGIFEMDPSMKKTAESLTQFYSIMSQQNKNKVNELQLTELPLRDHLKLNRSLTDTEKFQVESRIASVGAYVASPYSDPKNIPAEVLEARVFEQGDPKRMSKQQQMDFIAEIKEKALDLQDEEKEAKLKKKTIIAQKLHAVEVDQKDDARFRALVESDSKATELQVEAPTDKEKREIAREFADPRRNTFLIQEKRIENAALKIGVDMNDEETAIEDLQVLSTIAKEALFEQKRLAEENAEFQKRLERRKRFKELRKFEASLNYQQMNTDVDFADPKQNFEGEKVPKHPLYSDIPDLGKLKALQEKYNSMVTEDSDWDIHKKRSMKRVASFIREKIASEKGNIASITLFTPIAIDKVSSNRAMTVIYVFWRFDEQFQFNPEHFGVTNYELYIRKYKNMIQRKHEDDTKAAEAATQSDPNQAGSIQAKKINKRLNSFAKELSGMMCREMGFKYGPDIRFALSQRSHHSVEMKKELAEVIPDLMQKQLIEKFQSGQIPQKINKAQLALETDRRLIDMEEKMRERMESDEQLIAQAKAERRADKQPNQSAKPKERLREAKDAEGNKIKRMKKKKSKKSQQFWDSLDAY